MRPLRGPRLTPLKAGDRSSRRFAPLFNAAGKCETTELPISPLEGEMSGRTEGGVTERDTGTCSNYDCT
ncbi:MAG: hypothetical protein EOS27_15200 [Mesorhizobium sp.]|nr:MAG: hypothetical protein EOS27_15200 [Mesorhizobium sp.]TIX24811.1 MAG: hypothetical protein E5V35_16940 [Mesorhizobium sp.]